VTQGERTFVKTREVVSLGTGTVSRIEDSGPKEDKYGKNSDFVLPQRELKLAGALISIVFLTLTFSV
jgi:hypothetical protein